jgi:hypothetical protein
MPDQGCQIFIGTTHQKGGGEVPNNHTLYQMAETLPNGHKMLGMAVKYSNILHSQALKNIPELFIFGLQIYHLATLYQTIVEF